MSKSRRRRAAELPLGALGLSGLGGTAMRRPVTDGARCCHMKTNTRKSAHMFNSGECHLYMLHCKTNTIASNNAVHEPNQAICLRVQ